MAGLVSLMPFWFAKAPVAALMNPPVDIASAEYASDELPTDDGTATVAVSVEPLPDCSRPRRPRTLRRRAVEHEMEDPAAAARTVLSTLMYCAQWLSKDEVIPLCKRRERALDHRQRHRSHHLLWTVASLELLHHGGQPLLPPQAVWPPPVLTAVKVPLVEMKLQSITPSLNVTTVPLLVTDGPGTLSLQARGAIRPRARSRAPPTKEKRATHLETGVARVAQSGANLRRRLVVGKVRPETLSPPVMPAIAAATCPCHSRARAPTGAMRSLASEQVVRGEGGEGAELGDERRVGPLLEVQVEP